MSRPTYINCGTHGKQITAIVCRHHLDTGGPQRGVIVNSVDPEDMQCWCYDCEEMFQKEGDKTEAFREFCDFAVVCIECYERLTEYHHIESDQ